MSELDLSGAELKEMLRVAGHKLGAFLDQLPSQPLSRLEGSARLARRMDEPCPQEGQPFPRLLAQLLDQVTPVSLNTASGGYLAFIPGGGLPQAAVADLVTGVVNRFTGLWMPAPGWVQLETSVLRWMCAWVGYGPASGGCLTSGGSQATVNALVAAREAGLSRVYVSPLTHHCVAKAARIVGLPVVVLPVGPDLKLHPSAVPDEPGVLVASAGSTAVGAVDPLNDLADLAERDGHWFHVDGAYGGCFVLTSRGRELLQGIERADSIVLDPHKGLFLPYGTGALLVKDRRRLLEAFSVEASYLPEPNTDEDRWDFANLGPELSRPSRGLRLWLPLKMHGLGAFERALDDKLDLARRAAERVAALPHVRRVTPCELSLFAFRVEPPGHPDLDGLNRRILARVNQRQRVFLSGAVVPGEGFVGRVCVLSFRTGPEHIEELVEDLAEAIADPRG
jgi:aromatic-L-amino-acid decarboxylase